MIFEKIRKDNINYRKNKDKQKATVTTLLVAEIQGKEKEKKAPLTDDEVIDVLAKGVKNYTDTINEIEKKSNGKELTGTVLDGYNEAKLAIELLREYMPKQYTDNEAKEIIVKALSEVGATSKKQMGLAMKTVTPLLKGKYDNRKTSEIVKGILV